MLLKKIFGIQSGPFFGGLWVLLALLTLAGAVAGAPLQRQELNRSLFGLWTVGRGDHQLVYQVAQALPAGQAGIHPGDMLLTINGQPAGRVNFPDQPGSRMEITLRKPAGQLRQVTLTLQVPDRPVLGLPPVDYAWLSIFLDGLFVLIFLLMGALILWRGGTGSNVANRPQRRVALLVAYFLLINAIRLPPEFDLLLLYSWKLKPLVSWLAASGYFIFPLLLALFPNGRWQPRWIWVYPLVGLIYALVLETSGWSPARISPLLGTFVEILLVGTGVVAQVYRYYRAATPQERQQTKWAVFGIGSSFVLYYLIRLVNVTSLQTILLPTLNTDASASFVTTTFIDQDYLVLLAVPITLAVSILRYRLWDVDLIIRRTLVYTLLTTALAVVYFGFVILFQAVFRLLTGETSVLAIVLSTLAISLLFAPLRGLVRAVIDRRFYRQKYNADQMLESFTSTLRDEVDLDHLSGEVVQVVSNTFQPEQVSLWIRSVRD